jgi:AraC family transcriptional regulator
VRDYVHEHLSEGISLDDLAGAAGLSRFHFARCFRQTTGTSPHEFVVRERVARAEALLRRTHDPLLDIATRCGFADQSHMTRVVKKHLGRTPGQVRAGA